MIGCRSGSRAAGRRRRTRSRSCRGPSQLDEGDGRDDDRRQSCACEWDEVENGHDHGKRNRVARPESEEDDRGADAGDEADEEVAADIAADGAVDVARDPFQRGFNFGQRVVETRDDPRPSNSMKIVRKAIVTIPTTKETTPRATASPTFVTPRTPPAPWLSIASRTCRRSGSRPAGTRAGLVRRSGLRQTPGPRRRSP